MASRSESGKERRTGTKEMVEKRLVGRQKMLVLLSQLSGLNLYDADRPVEKVLKDFSIEDKIVRFTDKPSHHVFLEPEGRNTQEVYCNGISTSLPRDVQDEMIHAIPKTNQRECTQLPGGAAKARHQLAHSQVTWAGY